MPTDDTFEAATFGYANRVNIVARSEQGRAQNVTGFDFFAEISELADAFNGRSTEFLNVAEQGFGDALLFLIIETKLNGVVSVRGLSFTLHYSIRTGENDRYGSHHSFGVVNSCLPELLS
jgi:hypothetical protein